MTDEPIPQNVISWMIKKGWGEHHDQWHFERRWDFWHAMAARPDAPVWINQMIESNKAKGWKKSPIQEGEKGNGEDFLFMHRAMIQLLLDNFPDHVHYFRGWTSPPQKNDDAEDPVPPVAPGQPANPAKEKFDSNMLAAISKLQNSLGEFESDDSFGLFLETSMRPTPSDPLARSDDPKTGLHNYLHNRWSDTESSINLGDPTVNIFNYRFWKLHGWIDYSWWRFRRLKNLSDQSSEYQNKIGFYLKMMNFDTHHGHFSEVKKMMEPRPTRNLFQFDNLLGNKTKSPKKKMDGIKN